MILVAGSGCRAPWHDGEQPPGPAAQFLAGDPPASFRLESMYAEPIDRVVIACEFSESAAIRDALGFDWDGADLDIAENEQAVIAVAEGEVADSEVFSRKDGDFCGSQGTRYPATVRASARATITTAEWSDGSTYPVVDLP